MRRKDRMRWLRKKRAMTKSSDFVVSPEGDQILAVPPNTIQHKYKHTTSVTKYWGDQILGDRSSNLPPSESGVLTGANTCWMFLI